MKLAKASFYCSYIKNVFKAVSAELCLKFFGIQWEKIHITAKCKTQISKLFRY